MLSKADGDQAELVAYLDNELDDDARQRVERRLGEEPAYQKTLQQLQRSWDALDVLPSVPTSQRFTETTLEMVARRTQNDLERAERGDGSWWRAWSAVAVASGVLLAVFGIVFSAYRSAADHDLRELPMIDNVDRYRQVDSVEFLERLSEAGSFSGTVSTSGGVSGVGEISSDNLRALRELARDLATVEKERLRAKRERLERLSVDEQKRIRELHSDVTLHSDQAQLHRVLVHYTDWLSGLTARQQVDLKALSIDARIDAIRKMQHHQEQKALEEFAITPQDAVAIEKWLGEFARLNKEEMESRLPPELLRRLDSIKDPHQRRRMMIGAIYFSRSRGMRPDVVPTADQLQDLLDQLTPSVRQRLEQWEDPHSQFKTLVRWVRGYLRDRFRQVKKEDLEAFFYQLRTEQKERLEGMSPRQMQSELTGLYHRARFRDAMSGPPFGGRPFMGPDDFRRRGGPSRRRHGHRRPPQRPEGSDRQR